MHKFHWKALALGVALALSVVGTGTVSAQDRPDQKPTPDRQDQGPAPNEHARPDNARPADDTAARYRKGHPGAAARCHDGFFTKTTDRARACSKHGGIDVWLAL